MYEWLTPLSLQVLAVDLLNPSPAAEARKHKLKVRYSDLRVPFVPFYSYPFLSFFFRTCLQLPSLHITHSHSMPGLPDRCSCSLTLANHYRPQTLVPTPRSFFMDVKCPGCFTITTVFSHAQTVVICQGCSTVLCQPTGGKARLTEGCSFRRK